MYASMYVSTEAAPRRVGEIDYTVAVTEEATEFDRGECWLKFRAVADMHKFADDCHKIADAIEAGIAAPAVEAGALPAGQDADFPEDEPEDADAGRGVSTGNAGGAGLAVVDEDGSTPPAGTPENPLVYERCPRCGNLTCTCLPTLPASGNDQTEDRV